MSGPCDSVDASSSSSFPRRRTSVIVAPSSALKGGSNVFSTLMPGVATDSIACPGSTPARRRATISISGSSGTLKTLVGSSVSTANRRRMHGSSLAAVAVVRIPVVRVRLAQPGSGESQVASPKGETGGGPGPPECVLLRTSPLACGRIMDAWIAGPPHEIAHRIPRELEALVGISSPSGDAHGAEECVSVCAVLLPDEAEIERIPCSSTGSSGSESFGTAAISSCRTGAAASTSRPGWRVRAPTGCWPPPGPRWSRSAARATASTRSGSSRPPLGCRTRFGRTPSCDCWVSRPSSSPSPRTTSTSTT